MCVRLGGSDRRAQQARFEALLTWIGVVWKQAERLVIGTCDDPEMSLIQRQEVATVMAGSQHHNRRIAQPELEVGVAFNDTTRGKNILRGE